MPAEQVLSCMGAPAARHSVNNTEVWTYPSGGTTLTSSAYCTVSIVMTQGRVSEVNYTGRTGGLLNRGEQCAYAVEHCVSR